MMSSNLILQTLYMQKNKNKNKKPMKNQEYFQKPHHQRLEETEKQSHVKFIN